MNIGFSFTIISSIYAILLTVIFFSKKRLQTLENKVYSLIVLVCFIGSMISLALDYFMLNLDSFPTLNFIFSRLYLCYMLVYTSMITLYVIIITYITKNMDESVKKKRLKCGIIFVTFVTLIGTIIVNSLPMYYVSEPLKVYSYGPAVDALYVITRSYVVLWLIILFTNIKRVKEKKYWPMIIYIVFGAIISYIQGAHPEYLLATSMTVFVTFLMYFTIENPDLKLIRELEIARTQAEKANLAKTDFLSSMSHEIRTPLNAIVGFSECVSQAESLESAKNDAKDIVLASQNLLEIVNGILDISKIEANKMEVVESQYHLKDTLDGIVKLVSPRIGEKPIELKVNYASDLPSVLYGDAGKLKQVVTNILTNAVKYTNAGTITFECNCVNTNGISSLVISIEDTGRGIKPDKIDKLFNKFERLDEDRNTTTEGTGLGLAITKRLVELMGGKIVVQSVYGQGSKFTVYLKQKIVSMEQLVSLETDNKELSADLSGMKVLVVDDNSLNIKVALRLLKNYGINAESATSGRECIELVNAGKTYDLILMDDMMPKMTGTETFHKLKKITGFNTPVVALTANAISGMKEKYLKEGFDDYLAKPIEKNELSRILNIFTDNHFNPIIDTFNEHKLDTEYLKRNDVDLQSALTYLENMEAYNETLEEFVKSVEEKLRDLKKYYQMEDMTNYAIIAHSLKSDSKYLGFVSLTNIALEHELKSKKNDLIFIKENYNKLVLEVIKYIKISQKYLDKEIYK